MYSRTRLRRPQIKVVQVTDRPGAPWTVLGTAGRSNLLAELTIQPSINARVTLFIRQSSRMIALGSSS